MDLHRNMCNTYYTNVWNMVYVVIPQPPNHCSNFLRIITYGRMENEIYTAMQYLYVYHNYNPIKTHLAVLRYCWWKTSWTSWYGRYGNYPIIHRVGLKKIPASSLGFLPSTVPPRLQPKHQEVCVAFKLAMLDADSSWLPCRGCSLPNGFKVWGKP